MWELLTQTLLIRALRSELVIKLSSWNLSLNKYFAKILKWFWRHNFNIYTIFGIFRFSNFAKIQKLEYSSICKSYVQYYVFDLKKYVFGLSFSISVVTFFQKSEQEFFKWFFWNDFDAIILIYTEYSEYSLFQISRKY
jgi:hypothetical protein